MINACLIGICSAAHATGRVGGLVGDPVKASSRALAAVTFDGGAIELLEVGASRISSRGRHGAYQARVVNDVHALPALHRFTVLSGGRGREAGDEGPTVLTTYRVERSGMPVLVGTTRISSEAAAFVPDPTGTKFAIFSTDFDMRVISATKSADLRPLRRPATNGELPSPVQPRVATSPDGRLVYVERASDWEARSGFTSGKERGVWFRSWS